MGIRGRFLKKYFVFFILFTLTSFSCVTLFAQVNPQTLSQESLKRSANVPEFAFIQEEARKLGVKVYLFGGTASAFAHYVRWDLEREAGDDKYQAERFDYDFTNIYRGNQDLDIVVDGTAEQAAQLQEVLQNQYPHFTGSTDAWEVRLLRAQIGDKLPLLGDPDFKNQHTDTNSTGMLDLTAGPNEIVFRDLLDWENPSSNFLGDVAAARIKYLHNDKHIFTSRYKDGKNPPLFSAVRYLAKLTQYEVKGTEEDLNRIKKIVSTTDFSKLTDYVEYKVSQFALKTLLNSPNAEYAWNLLEETGLRERLIEMDGNQINSTDSLSWWMNKEPLRSFKIGSGEGRTASEIFAERELSEYTVAHETNSFQAYENITRSSKGDANVFISRSNAASEMAVHGDGFYTQIGTQGAAGTGITIRFEIDPNAREGTDFDVAGTYLIIKNKSAVKLIQENLNMSVLDFFKMLHSGGISQNDKGLIEKMKRRFNRNDISKEDAKATASFIQELGAVDLPTHFTDFWFDLTASKDYPEIAQAFISSNKGGYIAENVLSKKHWNDYPEFIEQLLAKKKPALYETLIRHVLSKEHWVHRPDFVQEIIDTNDTPLIKILIEQVLSKKWHAVHPVFISQIIKLNNDVLLAQLAVSIFSKSWWKSSVDLLEKLIDLKDTNISMNLIKFSLSQEHWTDRADLVQKLLDQNDDTVLQYVSVYITSQKHWAKHPEFVEQVFNSNKNWIINHFVKNSLSKKHWSHRSDFLQKALDTKNSEVYKSLAEYVFKGKEWGEHPDSIRQAIALNNSEVLSLLITESLPHEHWTKYPDLVELIIEKNDLELLKSIVTHILTQKHWVKAHPKFIREILLLKNDELYQVLAQYVLSQEHMAHSPHIVRYMIKNGTDLTAGYIASYVLSKEYWKDHPDLVQDILNLKSVEALQYLTKYALNKEHWNKHLHFIEQVIDSEDIGSITNLVSFTLSQSWWEKNPAIIKRIFDLKLNDKNLYITIIKSVLSDEYWLKHPEFIEELSKSQDDSILTTLSTHVFSNEIWASRPDLIKNILDSKSKDVFISVASNVLYKKAWRKYPLIAQTIINLNDYDVSRFILDNNLSQKYWRRFPEILVSIIKLYSKEKPKGLLKSSILSTLDLKHWRQHPELKAYLGDKRVSLKNLLNRMEKKDFDKWLKRYRQKAQSDNYSCKALL